MVIVLSGCAKRSEDHGALPEKTGYQEEAVWESQEGNTPAILMFSHDSGVYEENELSVTVSTSEEYTIAYTTDGSVPTIEADTGSSKIRVGLKEKAENLSQQEKTMVCRDFTHSVFLSDQRLPGGSVLSVSLVDQGGMLSEPVTKIYFMGIDFAELYPGALILSVYADPSDLLDYETGILAAGAKYEAWRSSPGASKVIFSDEWWNVETNSTQSGKAWERPVQLRIYEPGETSAEVYQAGIRIQGGVSRRMNQKSFNLYFREEYGTAPVKLRLFGKEEAQESFTLRNGGNDCEYLKYKDALLQSLAEGLDVTALASRPAVLFLNGEYWGPYNLNEKPSGQMLENRYGVDRNQVVIIKESEVEGGEAEDLRLFRELMEYAEKDLSDPDLYEEFIEVMDVQSMADYFAVRIYIGDDDWRPDKNDVLWRTRDRSFNEGRWQYILYDTEYSCDHYRKTTSAGTDHFQKALEQFPLFAAAMRNPAFSDLFLQSLKEVGSNHYNIENVRKAAGEYEEVWKPLMADYYLRFGDTSYLWEPTLDQMLSFFEVRYDYIIPYAEAWAEEQKNASG